MGWCQRETQEIKPKLLEILKEPNLKQKSQKLLEYSSKDVAKKMIKNLVWNLK